MPGPRVYTIDEVQALVPRLERIFERIEKHRAELKTLHIRISALELIWGRAVHSKENPDHGEFSSHVGAMKALEEVIEKQTTAITKLSGEVKRS